MQSSSHILPYKLPRKFISSVSMTKIPTAPAIVKTAMEALPLPIYIFSIRTELILFYIYVKYFILNIAQYTKCTVLRLLSSRFLILRSTQGKKAESSLFRGLTPSFHVSFHVICFFSTNERVIIYCKSQKLSQENFYD